MSPSVCGIDPNALTPQMEAAREAGIAVVDMHLADVSVPADPLIAGQTNGEFNKSMVMGVYSALIASGGEPIDVFVITSNENPPSVGMEQTVKDTLAELLLGLQRRVAERSDPRLVRAARARRRSTRRWSPTPISTPCSRCTTS